MSTPLLSRKSVFAAKIETTAGTAETITAAEGVFNAQDILLNANPTFTERPGQGGVGRRPSTVEGHTGQMTFRTEVGYDGTNIPTWASVLFPACGLVDNGSGVFFPRFEAPGTNVKTLTLAQYLDGKRRTLRGASGTFQMVFETGKLAYIDWTFSGIWGGETAVALIAPNYPEANTPLRVSGGATSFAGVNACCRQITFDVGNTVVGLECNDNTSNVTGFHYFLITDRNPTITGDPLSRLIAGQDRMAMMFGSTEGEFIASIAAPSASAVTLNAPKAQLLSSQLGDRDGMAVDQLQWQCNRNVDAVDQEFSIAFT
ncbi:hypothetical protein SH449x_000750 [Pirellulaceae bacterium SH449]